LAIELDAVLVLQPFYLIFGQEVEGPEPCQQNSRGDHEADYTKKTFYDIQQLVHIALFNRIDIASVGGKRKVIQINLAIILASISCRFFTARDTLRRNAPIAKPNKGRKP
jgi:hypothetical protein